MSEQQGLPTLPRAQRAIAERDAGSPASSRNVTTWRGGAVRRRCVGPARGWAERMPAVVALFVLALVPGCAGFVDFQGQSRPWPPLGRSQPRAITVAVSGAARDGYWKPTTTPEMLEQWQDATLRVYRESGLFSQVTPGQPETSLHAEVSWEDAETADIGLNKVMQQVTATLIPTTSTRTLSIRTTFYEPSGAEIATIEKSGTVTVVVQAFLFVLTPFLGPTRQLDSLRDELLRSTLLEAQERIPR